MIRIAIAGAAGRMGRVLIEAVAQHPETRLGAALERSGLLLTIFKYSIFSPPRPKVSRRFSNRTKSFLLSYLGIVILDLYIYVFKAL